MTMHDSTNKYFVTGLNTVKIFTLPRHGNAQIVLATNLK